MRARDHIHGEMTCFNEAREPKDFERLSQFFDRDCRLVDCTDPGSPVLGNAAVRDYCKEIKAALPDFHMVWEPFLEEGARVATQIRLSGTHTGSSFRGVEATGKRIEWEAAAFWRLNESHDRIVEEYYYYDSLVLDAQLRGPGEAEAGHIRRKDFDSGPTVTRTDPAAHDIDIHSSPEG